MRLLYGGDQLLGRGVFEQVAFRARPQAPEDVLVIVEGGQYDGGHTRVLLGEAPDELDPVHARHAGVHQRHVGPGAPQETESVDSVCGLAHHLDGVLYLEQLREPPSHERLVVHDEDLYRPRLDRRTTWDERIGSSTTRARPPSGRSPQATVPPRASTRSLRARRPKPPSRRCRQKRRGSARRGE